jgi:hypothetical protein
MLRYFGKSPSQSQKDWLSDEVIGCIAGLSPVEYVLGKHHFLSPTHLDGLSSIFAARPAEMPLSEFATSILDYLYLDLAITATVRGDTCSLEPIIARHHRSLVYESISGRLAGIGHDLTVRLPRLVALTRTLREQPLGCLIMLAPAAMLTDELIELHAESTETDLLHQIDVGKTKLPEDATMVKYSFRFRSNKAVNAAAL